VDFTFFTPWHQVLPAEAGHVVAFSGGRGKDGLVEACAAVFAAAGLPVARSAPGEPDPGDGVVVLADADGPADRPLRLPGPALAWPGRTSLAVVEVGVAVAGGFVRDALEPADAERAGLAPDAVFTWDDLADLLLDPARTGLPPAAPIVLALTGLREQPDSIGLFGFAGRVMADPRLPVVLFCGGEDHAPAIRACCRAAAGDAPGTRSDPEG